jgi:uncharacterized protein
MPPASNSSASFQSQFHQRWGDLHDPHVRALAWLLCAPDLLDAGEPLWQGRIASLDGTLLRADLDAWLHALDREPIALHHYLGTQPFIRLGRYAEKLMAFYLAQQGVLVAHGVQVRSAKQTIGEFDFLLSVNDQLLHWEFATKFYLLESSGNGRDADYFVGPNLADTLGAKMRKIFDRQLKLSEHPAAREYLPAPVVRAQALVKGWLFYHDGPHYMQADGTSATHCRGFWLSLAEMDRVEGDGYTILQRLDWLAPARLRAEQAIGKQALQQTLIDYFAHDTMPVMIAALDIVDGMALEKNRGFIVPDDWQTRAAYRTKPLSH